VWFHRPVQAPSELIPRWAILATCFLVAVGMTLPVWTATGPSLIGHWPALDLAGSVWAHWWTADALSRGVDPFVGTHSFYPVGMDPVLQFNLVDAMVGAPWVWGFGPRVGYNLAATAALITTGLAGTWLARGVGASRAGGLLCGVSIQASSFVALELYEGRISQVCLVFWLLALGGLVRLIRDRGGMGLALLTGLAAALAAGVYWYHGLALLLAGLCIVGASRAELRRQIWTRLGVSIALGLLLCLPFVLALLENWGDLPGVGRMVEDPRLAGNPDHLGSGVKIAAQHSRWLLWPLIERAGVDAGHQLSLVLLALAGLAVYRKVPGRGRWLMVAGIGWLLALGPKLHGYSEATDISLPFGWIQSLVPAMERMWWPQRFELLSVVGVSVLAGLGLDRFIAGRARRRLWLLAALVLSLVDAPLRSGVLPVEANPVPRVSAELYEGLEGPLLTVPVVPSVLVSTRAMYLQTHHGQPTLGGDGEHLPSHRPPALDELIEGNDLLRALRTLSHHGEVEATIQPEAVDALIEKGFVYAVTDPAVYPDEAGRLWTETHGRLFRTVFGQPMHEAGGGAVWLLGPIEGPVQIDLRLATGSQRRRR